MFGMGAKPVLVVLVCDDGLVGVKCCCGKSHNRNRCRESAIVSSVSICQPSESMPSSFWGYFFFFFKGIVSSPSVQWIRSPFCVRRGRTRGLGRPEELQELDVSSEGGAREA